MLQDVLVPELLAEFGDDTRRCCGFSFGFVALAGLRSAAHGSLPVALRSWLTLWRWQSGAPGVTSSVTPVRASNAATGLATLGRYGRVLGRRRASTAQRPVRR